tara:strand:+ start:3106 stop:3495 length:390 start_codon:yes stop_codon:yes gene_type:complete
MHEFSICQNVLEQVEQVTRRHHARRVTRIVLSVGPLSGVVDTLLQRAFDALRLGSVAETAVLDIHTPAVVVACPSCKNESPVPTNRLVCPHCQQWQTALVSGDELVLLRIEFAPNTLSANGHSMENKHV